MRRRTKEMIKRITKECNMTPAQRNKALIEEQVAKFKARGGKVKYLQATDENIHEFVSGNENPLTAIEFLQA